MDLEDISVDVTRGANALRGPHCEGTGAGAQELHVSLGSAGKCVCQATIRRADGTLHTQVPKPCNVRPQCGFLSKLELALGVGRGLAFSEGEEKLQRKKQP